MNKCVERLYNGIIKENPTFVLMLGMCPTLAVTTTAINGVGMGLSTTAVLVFSNLFISALRKIIPDRVRIPAYIVIVASLVTIVQLLLQAYIPSLYESLGIFIPLIVVNCIILGRAEAYAAKNGPVESAFDGNLHGKRYLIYLLHCRQHIRHKIFHIPFCEPQHARIYPVRMCKIAWIVYLSDEIFRGGNPAGRIHIIRRILSNRYLCFINAHIASLLRYDIYQYPLLPDAAHLLVAVADRIACHLYQPYILHLLDMTRQRTVRDV